MMNNSRLQRKREKLQAKINISKQLLEKNIQNFSVFDYIIPRKQIPAEILKGIIQNPVRTLETTDFIAGHFLSDDHQIRQIISDITIMSKAYTKLQET